VYEAVARAEEDGVRVGYVRLKTIWPFPDAEVARLAAGAKRIIVPELNLGQVAGEVRRVAGGAKVIGLNKVGGGELITPEEILSSIKEAA
jgi:2-oxoglutarate ferredoxin oxidoreductase subunit alpha